ncbi:MAG: hypothetical protein GX644_11190 [Limnobacter sp.]|nr:hypothetical protein [Limnobacter sp.]
MPILSKFRKSWQARRETWLAAARNAHIGPLRLCSSPADAGRHCCKLETTSAAKPGAYRRQPAAADLGPTPMFRELRQEKQKWD